MQIKLIECPHCNYKHENSLDYIDTGDTEGSFPMNCEKCDKDFSVEFTTTFKFESHIK